MLETDYFMMKLEPQSDGVIEKYLKTLLRALSLTTTNPSVSGLHITPICDQDQTGYEVPEELTH